MAKKSNPGDNTKDSSRKVDPEARDDAESTDAEKGNQDKEDVEEGGISREVNDYARLIQSQAFMKYKQFKVQVCTYSYYGFILLL